MKTLIILMTLVNMVFALANLEYIKISDYQGNIVTLETEKVICTIKYINGRVLAHNTDGGCSTTNDWVILGNQLAIDKDLLAKDLERVKTAPSRANGVALGNIATIKTVNYNKTASFAKITLVFSDGYICTIDYYSSRGEESYKPIFEEGKMSNHCFITVGSRAGIIGIKPTLNSKLSIFGGDILDILKRDTYE